MAEVSMETVWPSCLMFASNRVERSAANNVGASVNWPFAVYSRRTRLGVTTVNLAWPTTICDWPPWAAEVAVVGVFETHEIRRDDGKSRVAVVGCGLQDDRTITANNQRTAIRPFLRCIGCETIA